MIDPVPSGREVLERLTTATGDWQLQRREGHYEIICNGVFLMASYNRESSRQLASLALSRVRGDRLRVLVGGLGIGYTAGAVLEDPRVVQLDLVEVEPVVVRWHREYFAPLVGRPLDDPRTRLILADLSEVALSSGTFDALLLDTDNYPERIVREQNSALYDASGISGLFQALRPGGVMAFWAADRAPMLAARLRRAADAVEEMEVPELIAPTREEPAWIYVARRKEERYDGKR
ncbi:MAG TPA: spermine/spermidine synthase [bacterium]|nr:spermine/spermidine synthase [bacterium]